MQENEKEPTSVLIDGVLVPSYQTMWEKNMEQNCRIERLVWSSVIQGIAIIVLAIALLLK